MKERNVQISERLFVEMYILVEKLKDNELDHELLDNVYTKMNAKLEANKRRQLYTDSKTATTEEEREIARKAYIESIGMHEDFKY